MFEENFFALSYWGYGKVRPRLLHNKKDFSWSIKTMKYFPAVEILDIFDWFHKLLSKALKCDKRVSAYLLKAARLVTLVLKWVRVARKSRNEIWWGIFVAIFPAWKKEISRKVSSPRWGKKKIISDSRETIGGKIFRWWKIIFYNLVVFSLLSKSRSTLSLGLSLGRFIFIWAKKFSRNEWSSILQKGSGSS